MTRLATDLSEGTLSPYDRLRARIHLLVCRGCRTYHEQLRVTASALGDIEHPDPPEDLLAALRQELDRQRRRTE